jgi:hypothetical protein
MSHTLRRVGVGLKRTESRGKVPRSLYGYANSVGAKRAGRN